MKIDRLLSIIIILLQRTKVTAPELARKFEVSRRTIYRDIEDICKAGIPLITCQGGSGGISIADGYQLDKSVLSVDELQSIITGLKSLNSVSDTPAIERLISKLSPNREGVVSVTDNIFIDLSSHYKASLSGKIGQMKSAISSNKLVRFEYYSNKGVSDRVIEPYLITFRWTAWYVFGYCTTGKGFRLFKLNRLWQCAVLDKPFSPREVPAKALSFDDYFEDQKRITILFDPSVAYRLVEEYGPDCYKPAEDGRLRFSIGYTNKDYMIAWVLGFGDKAKVIEPIALANEIKEKAVNMSQIYEHDI